MTYVTVTVQGDEETFTTLQAAVARAHVLAERSGRKVEVGQLVDGDDVPDVLLYIAR